jgi:hypothetical protein
MSSKVGYGVEVSGSFFDEEVSSGEFEMLVDEKFPLLQVVASRAEYGDEVRTFLFVKSSIVKAGRESTAAAISAAIPASLIDFREAVAQSGVTAVNPEGWYLVDYYVYS